MWWIKKGLPPQNVVQEDLESSGIDFEKWFTAAQSSDMLVQKLLACYARHYGKRKFDQYLHECGVRLRLNSYCEWLQESYPELRKV